MAKAVKDHRSKKNPQSHEAHQRRKKEQRASMNNAEKFREQRWWRRDQLHERHSRQRLTKKNAKEVITVFGASSSDSIILAANQLLEAE